MANVGFEVARELAVPALMARKLCKEPQFLRLLGVVKVLSVKSNGYYGGEPG